MFSSTSSNSTQFIRQFLAGPIKNRLGAFDCTSEDRAKLMTTIYSRLDKLQKSSKEWKDLASSAICWEEFYQPFNLEEDRSWERMHGQYYLKLINRKRSSSPFSSERFERELKLAFSHQNVALEGNRLEIGDTIVLFKKISEYSATHQDIPSADFLMETIKQRSSPKYPLIQHDVIEFRNSLFATDFIINSCLKKQTFNEDDVKKINAIILRDISKNEITWNVKNFEGKFLTHTIGEYRKQNAASHGAYTTIYPYPMEVSILMKKLIEFKDREEANPTLHPYLFNCKFYSTFLHIHPFSDGNGRCARLLSLLMMLKKGYEPIIFQSIERSVYIDALFDATSNRNPDKWYRLILDSFAQNHEIM